ncbi:hypothetical protein J3F83DRAFT_696619 [Trichoderma novae-zelandiae]
MGFHGTRYEKTTGAFFLSFFLFFLPRLNYTLDFLSRPFTEVSGIVFIESFSKESLSCHGNSAGICVNTVVIQRVDMNSQSRSNTAHGLPCGKHLVWSTVTGFNNAFTVDCHGFQRCIYVIEANCSLPSPYTTTIVGSRLGVLCYHICPVGQIILSVERLNIDKAMAKQSWGSYDSILVVRHDKYSSLPLLINRIQKQML